MKCCHEQPLTHRVWQSVTKHFWNVAQRSGTVRYLFIKGNIQVYQVNYNDMKKWEKKCISDCVVVVWNKDHFPKQYFEPFWRRRRQTSAPGSVPVCRRTSWSPPPPCCCYLWPFLWKRKRKMKDVGVEWGAHWWPSHDWVVTLWTLNFKLLVQILWHFKTD